MKEVLIKKCSKCGAVIRVLKDCNCSDECGIKCCGEAMQSLEANSSDGAFEKHIPEYEINGNKITVRVNHVMEENHYIEWISALSDEGESIKYFAPGMEAVAIFDYYPSMILYSYCNKHNLWKKNVN